MLKTQLFLKLKQVGNSVMLDHSMFGFFERCQEINGIFSQEDYFLRFYECRNKFRFQLRKKLRTKNETKRELSTCAIEKFNGYEFVRNHLQYREKRDFVPINIVYEPVLDEKKQNLCFFAPSTHLAYHTSIEKSRGGEKKMIQNTAKQRHYCYNYFVKSEEKMKKHLSCCAGKAGFVYSFGNGKIID